VLDIVELGDVCGVVTHCWSFPTRADAGAIGSSRSLSAGGVSILSWKADSLRQPRPKEWVSNQDQMPRGFCRADPRADKVISN
jgi:hypothetical protein